MLKFHGFILFRSIVFNALKMLDGAIDLSLGKLNMPACFV